MHDKAFRKIYSGQLFLLLIAITFSAYSCDHYNENIIINDSCTGVVTKKYIDYSNHATHTLWIQGKGDRNDICYLTSYGSDSVYLYNKVSIGDSVIKKPGNKMYHVKSPEKDFVYIYKGE